MADWQRTHGAGRALIAVGTMDARVLRKVEEEGRATSAVLTHLYIYPVKSTRGIALTSAGIAATGCEWDRRWMIVDENALFITQRTHPDLARIVPQITAGRARAARAGTSRPLRPVHEPGAGACGADLEEPVRRPRRGAAGARVAEPVPRPERAPRESLPRHGARREPRVREVRSRADQLPGRLSLPGLQPGLACGPQHASAAADAHGMLRPNWSSRDLRPGRRTRSRRSRSRARRCAS